MGRDVGLNFVISHRQAVLESGALRRQRTEPVFTLAAFVDLAMGVSSDDVF
jgi:hypothetical protein